MPRSIAQTGRTDAAFRTARRGALVAVATVLTLAACDDPASPGPRTPFDVAQLASASAAAPADLGTFGGRISDAYDVNNLGQAVGGAAVPSEPYTYLYHAFVWQNGSMVDLTPGAAHDSRAHGVNDAGLVVGYRAVGPRAGEDWRAVAWEGGVLAELSGVTSTAWDVNAAGVVVGEMASASGAYHAARWTRVNGTWTVTDLDPDGTSSVAFGINDAGDVVGAREEAGVTHATLWRDGQAIDLGTIDGSTYSAAHDVNGAGQVVGYCRIAPSLNVPCIWEGGAAARLPLLSGASSAAGVAWDIAEDGRIVGEGFDAQGRSRALLWEDGVPSALPSLAPDATATDVAFAISDEGLAAGQGYLPTTSEYHAAVWTLGGSAPRYDFSGFLQPVDGPGAGPTYVVNRAKAGSAIPVKFRLGGDRGLDIFEPGYPKSVSYDCASGSATFDQIEQTVAAAGSGLSYDAVTSEYTYVWKTAKEFAPGCRKLVLGLKDGSAYFALFSFTR